MCRTQPELEVVGSKWAETSVLEIVSHESRLRDRVKVLPNGRIGDLERR